MHQTFLDAWNRLVKDFVRDGCDMAKQKVKPLMRGRVEFQDTGFRNYVPCRGSL